MIVAKLTKLKIRWLEIVPEPVTGGISPESIAAMPLFRGLPGLACDCSSQRRQAV